MLKKEDEVIKVIELFAGVGGFHLGLSRSNKNYKVVWANQFEPSRKFQFAYKIYENNFPNTMVSNLDIHQVDKENIPDADLLVGGFPCQDYSVARASNTAKGLEGKKGVLWWDIRDTLIAKKPRYVLLENVDRLLTSPGVRSSQPGRDFAMILKTLSELGYSVFWKMINAADYGYPQKRKRTYIFAFCGESKFKQKVDDIIDSEDVNKIQKLLKNEGPFSKTLRNKEVDIPIQQDITSNIKDISDNFSVKGGFKKIGVMSKGKVWMTNYTPSVRTPRFLKDILSHQDKEELYLSVEQTTKIEMLKKGYRTTKIHKESGHEYPYGMGSIPFPDNVNAPARTIITSERSLSRTSHVVRDPENGRLRFLSPEETEKINTFPPKWTELEGVSNSARYFTMGNALVVDLVKEMADIIGDIAEVNITDTKYGETAIQNKEVIEIRN